MKLSTNLLPGIILFFLISCETALKNTNLEEESKNVIIVEKLNAQDALSLKEAGKVDCQINTNENFSDMKGGAVPPYRKEPNEACENILRNKAQQMGAEVIVLTSPLERHPRCAYTPLLKTEYSHCIKMKGVAYKRK